MVIICLQNVIMKKQKKMISQKAIVKKMNPRLTNYLIKFKKKKLKVQKTAKCHEYFKTIEHDGCLYDISVEQSVEQNSRIIIQSPG